MWIICSLGNSWAAKQGDWYGRLLVADCYFEGNGVKQDYKEAVKWYELTAAHLDKNGVLDWVYPVGYPASVIAQCYREGLGVKKDLEKAAEWYEKAGMHDRANRVRNGEDEFAFDVFPSHPIPYMEEVDGLIPFPEMDMDNPF